MVDVLDNENSKKKKNCDLIKASFFDDIDTSQEFDFPLWVKGKNLEKLLTQYYYISDEKVYEGPLYKRQKDSDDPKEQYFVLYRDRLECYKVNPMTKIRRKILKFPTNFSFSKESSSKS